MVEVKEAKVPEQPRVLQISVQKGQINYNGEVKDIWIASAGTGQLVFDKFEQAIEVAQKALDEFKGQ